MNRFTRFHIQHFKSLVDFELPFPDDPAHNLVCLIGLNGSGKSTVLQALDFMGQLFRGNLNTWFSNRGWQHSEIASRSKPISRLLNFTAEGRFAEHDIKWQGTYNINERRCTAESFLVNAEPLLTVKDLSLTLVETHRPIIFKYKGSIASGLRELAHLHPTADENIKKRFAALEMFTNAMRGVYSFDTITPQLLRNRSRKHASSNIGRGGEYLAGQLATMEDEHKEDLEATLRHLYPWIYDVKVVARRGGWNEIQVREHLDDEYVARIKPAHTCDGVLRMLALLTEMHAQDTLIMFDEVENGFNPELVQALVSLLVEYKKQCVITTHNPVMLNYLPSDMAEHSVFYMFREACYKTQGVRFATIPDVQERLAYMGYGEVFADINQNALVEHLIQKQQPAQIPERTAKNIVPSRNG